MIPYRSKSGKSSGVTAYEIGHDYIKVQFNFSDTYIYSEKVEEKHVIDEMKSLAITGSGQSTFISRNQPRFL